MIKRTQLGIVLGLICTGLFISHQAFGDVSIHGDVIINTNQTQINANYTSITVRSLSVDGTGMTLQDSSSVPIRTYTFHNDPTYPSQFNVQWQGISNFDTNFNVLTTGLTNVVGTVTGSNMSQAYVDGVIVSHTWDGTTNTFNIGSGHIVRELFVYLTETVRAFLADGVTALYGSILQTNSTSSNNAFTLFSGVATIPGLADNQNFSAKNALINFIVKKQYNYNVTANPVLNMTTYDYVVNCPYIGNLPAIELWTGNETDGHRISSVTSPTCYANNTVKWSDVFTANGKSGSSYSTIVKAKVLNNTFLDNGFLKANNTVISTGFTDPYITSASIPVGTGLQTILLNMSLNLTINSNYVPNNFTIGNLTISGQNLQTIPIIVTRTDVNKTDSTLTVTYPSGTNVNAVLTFQNANQTLTYNSLTPTPSGLGKDSSTLTFKNPNNDMVTAKFYDTSTNQNATYILQNTQDSIPLIEEVKNFTNGTYGTHGQLANLDLVTLIIVILSMIGLNRVNETVGVVLSVITIGALSYFHLITFPTLMIPAIALILLVTVGSTKKLPWS